MMNLKPPKEHKYFVFSKFANREITEPIIFESKINFNQKEFVADVKEQMKDLEIEKEDLAKLCYLPKERVKAILNCRGKKITEEEIKEIKKKLSIS